MQTGEPVGRLSLCFSPSAFSPSYLGSTADLFRTNLEAYTSVLSHISLGLFSVLPGSQHALPLSQAGAVPLSTPLDRWNSRSRPRLVKRLLSVRSLSLSV